MTGSNYINTTPDSPQRLAAKLYGDWTLHPLITGLNPMAVVDNLIKPGVALHIPDIMTGEVEHTIIEGDTYENLSLQYYGIEHFSGKIFSENDGLVLHENIGNPIIIPGLVES